jgi:hypothetical protein
LHFHGFGDEEDVSSRTTDLEPSGRVDFSSRPEPMSEAISKMSVLEQRKSISEVRSVEFPFFEELTHL